MSKVNYKQLYINLKKQLKSLEPQQDLSLPSNFNHDGWAHTEAIVLELLAKLEKVKEIKGKRMTPPSFKTLYNRVAIVSAELSELIENIEMNSDGIDYEAEVIKLNLQLAEKFKGIQSNGDKDSDTE